MPRLNEHGMTLLELLVAVTLLAIALVGLAASFPLAMYGVTLGGFQTTATLLAQESIEQAKAKSYGNLPNLATGVALCDPSAATGVYATVSLFPGFTRCISVQTAVPTATTTTVRVVVRFTTAGGDNIDTLVASIFSQ